MTKTLPEPYGVLYQLAPEYDVDVPEEETAAIRLLEPEYNGVVVRFHTVRFEESDDYESAVLKFEYNILYGSVKTSKFDFEITLGNFLYDRMLERLSQEDQQ